MEIKITITTENVATEADSERFVKEVLRSAARGLEEDYGCGCSLIEELSMFRTDYRTSDCEVSHREDGYDGPQVLRVALDQP